MVKIADTDKEKAQRRLQQAMTSLGVGAQFGGINNLTAFGLGMNTAAYYQQVYSVSGVLCGVLCADGVCVRVCLCSSYCTYSSMQVREHQLHQTPLVWEQQVCVRVCVCVIQPSPLPDLQALMNQQQSQATQAAAAAGQAGETTPTNQVKPRHNDDIIQVWETSALQF